MTQQPKETCQRTCRGPKFADIEAEENKFNLFNSFSSYFQEEELNNNEGAYRRMTKPCKGGARTGWPQHVWALELKQ